MSNNQVVGVLNLILSSPPGRALGVPAAETERG